jgi:DNA-binding PadR family transcriptional regulator
VATADGEMLPLTSYATLGLLSPGEEFSAVDIEGRAHQYLRFFYWVPALSHIRRELNRLEELGYVAGREVLLGRIKRTLKYRITPEGESALARWAESSTIERTVKKNPALLRLWLGRRAGHPDAVLSAFREHVEFVRSERQSVVDFMAKSEAIYTERRAERRKAGTENRADPTDGVARIAWHLAVMRYCLRDYDAELDNLGQLMADLEEPRPSP